MTALSGLHRQPWFWPAAASVVLMVMIGALSPELRYSIVTANLTAASFLALVGIGQMFPVASGEGGIDLSIPFVMNFCAFLAVQLITPEPLSIPLVLLLGIGFGVAVGLINGIVVVRVRVPPIIGTLAVGFIVLTLVQLISASGDTTFADRTLTNLMRSQFLGLPIPFYVLLAVAALAMSVIRRTAYGRTLLAVGQSRKAAHLSGLDVARKLVILAREAGRALSLEDVEVENLVPATLRAVNRDEFLARLDEMDAPMLTRYREAAAQQRALRHLAQLDADGRASVGVVALPSDHACCHTRLTDNLVQFRTRRYADNPLVVQGPGAGPDVVDDERPPVAPAIGDQPDVRRARGQPPGDDVAGPVVLRSRAHRERPAAPPEERGEVEDAAVVDIGVGPGQSPAARIRGEGAGHHLR